MRKKLIIQLVSFLLVVLLFVAVWYHRQKMTIDAYISDKKISDSVLVINGKPYMPINDLKEAFGLHIFWDKKNRRVLIEPSLSTEYVAKIITEKAKEYWNIENNYGDPSNITNFGLAAEDDEKYYIVAYNGKRSRNSLYALDKKTGSIEIISNMNVRSIVVDSENIYYVVPGDYAGQVLDGRQDDGRAGIYGYNKMTREKTLLTHNIGINLISIGDSLYYSRYDDNSHHLYRIKKDGTGEMKLTDKRADYMTFSGNFLYYADNNAKKIYRIDLKTGQEVEILNNVHAGDIQVVGNELFFTNLDDSGRLYKSGLRGEDVTPLSEFGIYYLNIQEGKNEKHVLYATDPPVPNGRVRILKYTVLKEGDDRLKEGKKLYEGEIQAINIVGDYVVFYNKVKPSEKEKAHLESLVYKLNKDLPALTKVELPAEVDS